MTDQEILNLSFSHILNQGKLCTDKHQRNFCHQNKDQGLISAFGIHVLPEEIDNIINYKTNIDQIIDSNKRLRWMTAHRKVLQEIIYTSGSSFKFDRGSMQWVSQSFVEGQIEKYISIAKMVGVQPPPEAANYLLLS